MDTVISRRRFLCGLGIAAAAAALTACSSTTNETVTEALIEGTVGGIVATNFEMCPGSLRHEDNSRTYYVKVGLTVNNVGTKGIRLNRDNFNTVIDGSVKSMDNFGYMDGEHSWRSSDIVIVNPGEERILVIEYYVSKPVYDDWYKVSHDVTVTFTCGSQRITYTANSRSSTVVAGEIETV